MNNPENLKEVMYKIIHNKGLCSGDATQCGCKICEKFCHRTELTTNRGEERVQLVAKRWRELKYPAKDLLKELL